MRPDLDDYEEASDLPEMDESRSRAMSWLVLGVAIAGFGALAYYAYHSGTQSVREGDTLVVEADKTPIKEAPVDPEGEQFANKDKTIYDVIAGDKPEKKVEKLLPEAESPNAVKQDKKPIAADGYEDADAAPATTTFVKKTNDTAAPKMVDAVDAAKAAKEEVVKEEPKPTKKEVAEVKTPSAAAPKMINEKSVVDKKTEAPVQPVEVAAVPVATTVIKEEPAPVKAPEKKPVVEKSAAEVTASGTYKIQLGAFQSDEEARGQWKKISAKFAGVIKGSPIIVRAELPNGTYYRLRASGFASADAAKAACATLVAKSQPCFPAGK